MPHTNGMAVFCRTRSDESDWLDVADGAEWSGGRVSRRSGEVGRSGRAGGFRPEEAFTD